ncbi:hypothetical protein [Albibacterium indicum]|uniref:hypothetical protein n=1 Tax=Albibacterium indicum TaxID=2292082 RepID=UPI000E50F23C|nr:hypothetical protein [Pedobacter indicus]
MRYVLYILVGVLTSFYVFPIGFSFLPSSINTKMILAVIGVALFAFKCINDRQIGVSKGMLGAILIALLFSVAAFFSADFNDTNDYSYATYIVSFGTWLGGAYTVAAAIRNLHGEASFKLLTHYLAAVCFAQCILALMIDNIPAFQLFIDSYVQQGQEFFTEVDRLYGIGAALDTAGVRFSITLIMIVGLLSHDQGTRSSQWSIFLLLIAFFTITLIGNMISRTTILGVGCAVAYFVFASGLFKPIVRYESIKLGLWFAGVMLFSAAMATYLYHTDAVFHDHMRFAFEGFFNWAETGVWRTDSTDKLNTVMWIWPTDLKTWIIGSGLFGNFIYGTDIGYCRFILYCGLVGFTLFATLFVYLTALFISRNPRYWLMFLFLMALSFLIWIKVATDIFQIYALFFCLDYFTMEPEEGLEVEQLVMEEAA